MRQGNLIIEGELEVDTLNIFLVLSSIERSEMDYCLGTDIVLKDKRGRNKVLTEYLENLGHSDQ